MKYVLLVPDGMADYPLRELSWRTPLMAAKAPVIKGLGLTGKMGTFLSLPKGTQAGSDSANMSVLGYDPKTQLTGRGPLESAARGLVLGEEDIAFRLNLVTESAGRIIDYSSGHIDDQEAAELIGLLGEELRQEDIEFKAGKSYRNLLLLKGKKYGDDISTTPPHDIIGEPINSHMPVASSESARETQSILSKIIEDSRAILQGHPINRRREKKGLNRANMAWPWGGGHRLNIRPFSETWGISGTVISAVDTVKGLAISAGMKAPEIPGATGFIDTNYEAKAECALGSLSNCDMVYIHVEATDEMGHAGDVRGKIKAIEDFDSRIAKPVISGLESLGVDYRVAVIPDHYTPCTVRTHVRDPTPFVISSSDSESSSGLEYNEENAKEGPLGLLQGRDFMRTLIENG